MRERISSVRFLSTARGYQQSDSARDNPGARSARTTVTNAYKLRCTGTKSTIYGIIFVLFGAREGLR